MARRTMSDKAGSSLQAWFCWLSLFLSTNVTKSFGRVQTGLDSNSGWECAGRCLSSRDREVSGVVSYQGDMLHCVQRQVSIGPPEINAGQRDAFRCEPFADNENYPKWLLDDPMLKIKNAQSGKNGETQKGEQLIAPLHQRDVAASDFYCQRKNRLSGFIIVGRVRAYGRPRHPHHSRWLGNQSRWQRIARAKWRCHSSCQHALSRPALSRLSGK